jgi:hypothetical protein
MIKANNNKNKQAKINKQDNLPFTGAKLSKKAMKKVTRRDASLMLKELQAIDRENVEKHNDTGRLLKNSMLETIVRNPSLYNGFVHLPQLPHTYVTFSDKFTFSLPVNANGALGLVAMPAYLPTTIGMAGCNIGYWNGAGYTGVGSVPTSLTNPFSNTPSNNYLYNVDSALANFTELSLVAYKLSAYTTSSITTASGQIAMAMRQQNYRSIGSIAPFSGTPLTAPSRFDSINYTGVILDSNSIDNVGLHSLNTGKVIEACWRPAESHTYVDLLPFRYNAAVDLTTAPFDTISENIILASVTGATPGQIITFMVEGVYAGKCVNKSVLTQNARLSMDSRSILSVFYDISKNAGSTIKVRNNSGL